MKLILPWPLLQGFDWDSHLPNPRAPEFELYVYVCMYVCMYVYLHLCVCIDRCIYTICIELNVSEQVCMYVQTKNIHTEKI